MDYTQVKEVIEFSSNDAPIAANINAYLKHGWIMLSCCTQTSDIDDSQHIYVLLGWDAAGTAPHLGKNFNLTD